MTRLAILSALALVFALGGCKKDEAKKGDGPEQERGERGGPGDDERGGPGDQGEMPWPPPGGEKAPAPPAVTALMGKLVNAFNNKDAETVQKYFITRTAFLVISDCDPPNVVDRVMDGARQTGERAKRDGGNVAFKGFAEGHGYLFDIKVGEKPAECRAKAPVQLFMAKYDWTVNGTPERGEAHFLRYNGIWFFVKL